jgi:signal transduction histidine kinase
LQIAVRDNGPGLSEEQRRHIFEPFYTTKVKGTGLGTSIARRIVETHGGQVVLGDSSQLGTEILITLPKNS